MQLARHVKFRAEKFGGVLFQTQTEKVFTLNPCGVAVVREIEQGAAPEAIVARLRTRFADPAGRLEGDVHALLGELRDKGLVVAEAS